MEKPKTHRKRIPKDCYCFPVDAFPFQSQETRILNEKRPNKFRAFIGTSHKFVYNGFNGISMLPDEDPPLPDVLNDTLFSHSLFPDTGAEWELLFSIKAHESPEYVCPICLFKPVAPRITKCGHIYCADCIDKYLSLSEQATCPVCGKRIRETSLVRCELDQAENDMKDTIKFKKLMKNKRNCLCYDCNSKEEDKMIFIPFATQESSKFNRFMLANTEHINSVIKKELDEITEQIKIYNSEEFLDKDKVAALTNELEKLKNEKVPVTDEEPRFFLEEPPEEPVYIYQEESGKNIFLDKLSRDMLTEEYGSLKDAPNEIEVKVLSRKSIKVNEKFQKIHQSYKHIPLETDIEIIVADLSDFVSAEVVARHEEEITRKLEISESSEDRSLPSRSMSTSSFHSVDTPVIDDVLPQTQWSSFDTDFPSFSSLSNEQPHKKKKIGWGKVKIDVRSCPQTQKTSSSVPRSSSWDAALSHKK